MQLKLLKFTEGKTKAIVEKANREGIERHRDALRAVVKKVESGKNKNRASEIGKWRSGRRANKMERRS